MPYARCRGSSSRKDGSDRPGFEEEEAMSDRSKLTQAHHGVRSGQGRAGVTSGMTDTESGNDDAGVDRELYALKAMYDRGLIPQDVYESRRAELMAGSPSGHR